MSLIEELHKANHRLEEEIRILRLSAELPMGATSLNNVIEAQERKIKALEIARKVSVNEKRKRVNFAKNYVFFSFVG